MKYALMLLAVSTLSACQSPSTPQKTDRVTLTQCNDYTVTLLPASAPNRQAQIWVNDKQFVSEARREIPRNEYMPFHTYFYGSQTPSVEAKPYNIAALTAAPEGVTLLRYLDSTEVSREKCDITEEAIKAVLHDKSTRY